MDIPKHFVLYGLTTQTVRVARRLAESGASLAIIYRPEASDLQALVKPFARMVQGSADRDESFRDAGLLGAAGMLALEEDDLENLRAAVAARALAADVPITIRTFDSALADQLEQCLGIRRAFSVSALAAPTIVAAVFDEEVLETLRLGSTQVPICQLTVRANGPLAGITAGQLKRKYHCGLVASLQVGTSWKSAADDHLLAEGDEVLVGGLLHHVLHLAHLNSHLFGSRKRRKPLRKAPADSSRSRRVTLLPAIAVTLLTMLGASVFVFQWALQLSLVDAFYFVVSTVTTVGYGDITPYHSPMWVKLFDCLVMLAGAALLAILFSWLASAATAERLESQMGQRARKLSGHVVMSGLGRVGYRVAQQFIELGVPLAVVEISPEDRFVQAIREHAPVLRGDARLPEDLQRASIQQAAVFLACTDDELTNIQSCLHARRLNPKVRTVARLFDDELAERLGEAFQIDSAVSSTRAAASAFVGAAMGEHALRFFAVGDLELIAFRFTATNTVLLETIQSWRQEGVRVLGIQPAGADEQPPSQLKGPLHTGDAMIICGPRRAVEAILTESIA